MLDDPGKARLQVAAPATHRPEVRRWELPATVALWGLALAVAVQGFVRSVAGPVSLVGDRLPDLHVYVTAVSSFVHGTSLAAKIKSGAETPPADIPA